jgi:hypothetical protein
VSLLYATATEQHGTLPSGTQLLPQSHDDNAGNDRNLTSTFLPALEEERTARASRTGGHGNVERNPQRTSNAGHSHIRKRSMSDELQKTKYDENGKPGDKSSRGHSRKRSMSAELKQTQYDENGNPRKFKPEEERERARTFQHEAATWGQFASERTFLASGDVSGKFFPSLPIPRASSWSLSSRSSVIGLNLLTRSQANFDNLRNRSQGNFSTQVGRVLSVRLGRQGRSQDEHMLERVRAVCNSGASRTNSALCPFEEAVATSFFQVDNNLLQKIQKTGTEDTSGSCCVFAMLTNESPSTMVLACVGDSRIVASQNGEAVELFNSSLHTPGQLDEKERIETVPGKNGKLVKVVNNRVLGLAVSRAFGNRDLKKVGGRFKDDVVS